MHVLDFIGLFLFLSGFVVGLGAVTVIDLHGFLGRKSSYWTEATIRTHKVTKPLIWLGLLLVLLGGCIFYRHEGFSLVVLIHTVSVPLMMLNGLFLSFSVSPFMLKQEREGRGTELLPSWLQRKIVISFVISFILWWGNLGLLVYYLTERIG